MEAEISCCLKFKNRSTCKTQKLMISASIEQLKTRGLLSIYIIVSKIKAIEDTSSNIMTRNTYYEKLLVIIKI